MSTFYLLPPRNLLSERFAAFVRTWLPGLPGDAALGDAFSEFVESTLARHPAVYVVYREELPEGEDVSRALADGFGAEAGDEVIEVRLGTPEGDVRSRSWRVAAAAA